VAKVSKWGIFLRVFIVTLLSGSPGRSLAADDAEIAVWQRAVQQDSIASFYRYISLYPSGDYINEAVEALIRLGALKTPFSERQILDLTPPRAAGPRVTTPVRDPAMY
jgi:hypothetical protein